MTDRYDRQRRLDGIGLQGQKQIRAGRVLVVGMGGLGCPAASYLAAGGVAVLALMDDDTVDVTNLHRQTLYTQDDVGKKKVDAAAFRLRAMNDDVQVITLDERLDAATSDHVGDYDVVIDGTDDLQTKVLLASACRAARVPLVHAAASGWEGLITVLDPPETPCYHCLWPRPEPGLTCAEAGILGPVAGILGTLQAQEALKQLARTTEGLRGKLLLYDGRTAEATTVALKRRTGCECFVPVACPLPWNAPTVPSVSVAEFVAVKDQVFLLDVREPDEHEELAIPGSTLIPLGELPQRLGEVPTDKQVVVYCAVGGRSARGAQILRGRGIEAFNLRGGIQAWWAAGHAQPRPTAD